MNIPLLKGSESFSLMEGPLVHVRDFNDLFCSRALMMIIQDSHPSQEMNYNIHGSFLS